MEVHPWLALPAGVAIAAVASAVGIGGGVLWMPLLLLAWGLSPETAVLTSLLIQCVGMGSGAVAYARNRLVDLRLALVILAFAVPGLVVGAWLARRLGEGDMELLLGILVMFSAFLFVSSNERYGDVGEERVPPARMLPYSWVVTLGSVGSGMLSTAIGEWLVPVMRSRLSLRMTNAIATCILVTLANCVVAALAHFAMGSGANYELVAWAVPGVIVGGQIGPWVTKRIDERKLKEVFIFVLTLVGIHLVYNAY
ncbi:MAG: sulfite exporter TauE/SafE family protein [Desulfatibacillaceae bacterium]